MHCYAGTINNRRSRKYQDTTQNTAGFEVSSGIWFGDRKESLSQGWRDKYTTEILSIFKVCYCSVKTRREARTAYCELAHLRLWRWRWSRRRCWRIHALRDRRLRNWRFWRDRYDFWRKWRRGWRIWMIWSRVTNISARFTIIGPLLCDSWIIECQSRSCWRRRFQYLRSFSCYFDCLHLLE